MEARVTSSLLIWKIIIISLKAKEKYIKVPFSVPIPLFVPHNTHITFSCCLQVHSVHYRRDNKYSPLHFQASQLDQCYTYICFLLPIRQTYPSSALRRLPWAHHKSSRVQTHSATPMSSTRFIGFPPNRNDNYTLYYLAMPIISRSCSTTNDSPYTDCIKRHWLALYCQFSQCWTFSSGSSSRLGSSHFSLPQYILNLSFSTRQLINSKIQRHRGIAHNQSHKKTASWSMTNAQLKWQPSGGNKRVPWIPSQRL